MPSEHLEKVVALENERLNRINEDKALARLRDIASLKNRRKAIDKEIAELQKEIEDISWDSVTVESVLGSATE